MLNTDRKGEAAISSKSENQPFDIYDAMAEAWGAPIVARSQIEKFSGGAIKGASIRNLDVRGLGPDKVLIGQRNVAYVLRGDNGLVNWLRMRSKQ